MTIVEKLLPIVQGLSIKTALTGGEIAEIAELKMSQTSWGLCELKRTGKISKTGNRPFKWHRKTKEIKKELKFTETIEDRVIYCPARGYNGQVLLSECHYNPEHPDCLTCKDGMK